MRRPLTEDEQVWVADNMGLARKATSDLAFKMADKHLNSKYWYKAYYSDMIDAAYIAMCKGITGWKPEGGANKATYVYNCIWRELTVAADKCLLRYGPKYRKKKRVYRKHIGFFSDISANKLTSGGYHKSTPFDVLDRQEREPYEDTGELLEMVYKLLPKRLALIVELYVVCEMTLEKIGEQLGITKERSRQLLKKAMQKLKDCEKFMALARWKYEQRKEVSEHEFIQTAFLPKVR